jgi:beta-glucosidase
MFAFSAMSNAQQAKPIYLDDSKPIEERVENALSKMTLDEKIAMIHAQSKFSSPGVPRLGFLNFGLQMDLTVYAQK